jgi:hypothetical protein
VTSDTHNIVDYLDRESLESSSRLRLDTKPIFALTLHVVENEILDKDWYFRGLGHYREV